MSIHGNRCRTAVLGLSIAASWLLGGGDPGGVSCASRAVTPTGVELPIGDHRPAAILGAVRPDYRTFIGTIRPIATHHHAATGGRPIYMALVRPGADDPTRNENAPFTGPGVRNDILYARQSFDDTRSASWSLLLLDHEYFHARHLAGATSLPLPGLVTDASERHFFEAAAWGFNLAEARRGRYPGLREDEFREALDRFGEHYRALRGALSALDPAVWRNMSAVLGRPAALITTAGAPPSGVPARLADRDRSAAIR